MDYSRLQDLRRQTSSEKMWAATGEFCSKHWTLTDTIPLGLHAGWPTTIDIAVLAERVFRLGSVSREPLQWRGVKFYKKAAKAFKKGSITWRSEAAVRERYFRGR